MARPVHFQAERLGAALPSAGTWDFAVHHEKEGCFPDVSAGPISFPRGCNDHARQLVAFSRLIRLLPHQGGTLQKAERICQQVRLSEVLVFVDVSERDEFVTLTLVPVPL